MYVLILIIYFILLLSPKNHASETWLQIVFALPELRYWILVNCLFKTLQLLNPSFMFYKNHTYTISMIVFHKTYTFTLPCNQYPQDSTIDICDLWNRWLAKDSKSVTPIGGWPTFQNSKFVFVQIIYIGDRVCLCNWVSSGCQTSTMKMSL